MACGPEPEENLEHGIAQVREAAKRGAAGHLPARAFPDANTSVSARMRLCSISPNRFRGRRRRALADLCRELRVTAVVSLFERRAPGLYHNTAGG